MLLKQQVSASPGASGAGAWQTDNSRTADALIFLSLCTHTHYELFLLEDQHSYISTPGKYWCRTHKGLGFKSFTGACGWCLLKVAHRDHKDQVLTLLWCLPSPWQWLTMQCWVSHHVYRTDPHGTAHDHIKAQPGLAPRARVVDLAQVSWCVPPWCSTTKGQVAS